MCIKNYFLIGPRMIFCGIANLFFGLQYIAGLAVRVFDFLGRPFWKLCKWRSAFKENAKAKHCQGKKRKRFSSFLQNQELVVRRWWWGFLDRRFNRGDYEGTSRLVHNSSPYWTWHVCPIELFFTQSCTSSLCLVLHMLAFGTKTQRMRVSPTLKFRKKPPILIQTGKH